ncbi:MAG TPA: DUF456 family protein [Syntrophales bacterium]|nr:DUF456 family protein [Syntrophales bacterium]HOL59956.1 DUF456 family protein [Syntrophales bacterium]HPO35256.1 DUF456 family protein [Syntrophales bacterium]
MTSLEMVAVGIIVIVLFGALFLNIFGFPGTAVIFLAAFAYALVTGFKGLDGKTLILLFILTLMAEAIEFSLGFITTFYFGFSVRGCLSALVGSVVGMAVLTPPLMGWGTFLGLFLGGFGAVLVVELLKQMRLKPVFRASAASIFKRLCGTTVKGAIGLVMVLITMNHIYS